MSITLTNKISGKRTDFESGPTGIFEERPDPLNKAILEFMRTHG